MVVGLELSLPLLLLVGGIALAIAEAIAPGAHFIVLGVALISAGIIGLTIGAFLPLFAGPLALALLIVFFGSVALYGYRELDIYGGKGTGRTRDSSSLLGQTGRVTETVTPAGGEVKLDNGGFNPYFSARSTDTDIPVDTEVIVIDPGGGNVLTVESMEMIEDDIDRELAIQRDQNPTGTERTEPERNSE